ncbi:unnamed protein product [Microthlaspi erraticum]|uniref:Uncharacterized protein n=1 Tax=Microthlaspi erraticum TaxID=1685480 RepID=A0A6D2IRL9_9BRAS|nr:unnamed protein product [Microthlaspi erraticum]
MPPNANALPLSSTPKQDSQPHPHFRYSLPGPSPSAPSSCCRLPGCGLPGLTVLSSVLSEDRATGVSGSGTDAFKLTYLEVGCCFQGSLSTWQNICGFQKKMLNTWYSSFQYDF